MFSWSLLLIVAINRVHAQSLIPVYTFTDNKCVTASTTATNITIPLDTCITTTGMQSFTFPPTPCAGGGETTVQRYAYSDAHCVKTWSGVSEWQSCVYAWTAGSAFGSIMLTCKSTPQVGSASSTIIVGPAATGAGSPTSSTRSSATSSTSATNNNSSGPDSTSSSTFGSECSGFSCLSNGERIGIFVALGVGVPPILIALYLCILKIRKSQTTNDTATELAPSNWPRHNLNSWNTYKGPTSTVNSWPGPQHNNRHEWHDNNGWSYRT